MRFVIDLDVALRLIAERSVIASKNNLVAPTLLRSQVLSALFASTRRGDIDRHEANARPNHTRALKIRLLGDRVLQQIAWDVAETLGWDNTLQAEYVALTKLQADAFVTLDASLARSVEDIVPLGSFADLFS